MIIVSRWEIEHFKSKAKSSFESRKERVYYSNKYLNREIFIVYLNPEKEDIKVV